MKKQDGDIMKNKLDNIRAVRIYDNGYIHGLLIKEGHKFDYVLTLRTPLRLSKIKHKYYKPVLFSIPNFIGKLKDRLSVAKFKPSQMVVDFINSATS